MYFMKILAVICLATLSTSLHIMHFQAFDYSLGQYKVFYADNLENSNLNYYYGKLSPAIYSTWNRTEYQGKVCPPEQPYAAFSSDPRTFYKCAACAPIQNGPDALILFNLETRQCEPCITDKTIICNQLLKNTFTGVTSSTNKSSPSNSSSSSQTLLKTKTSGESVLDLCPPDHPRYNPNSKSCEECPANYEFDGPTQSCLPIIFTTNLQATNIIMDNVGSLDKQKRDIQNANINRFVLECPQQKPYLQDKACISCPEGLLFNLASQKCVKCDQGTFYNQETFKCEKSIFYSDITAANIVSQARSYDVWKAKAQTSSQFSPRMAQCPKEKPFEVNGKCISCSGDTPLFDIDRLECTSCSKGRSYDAEKRYCSASLDISSSWKRQFANVA